MSEVLMSYLSPPAQSGVGLHLRVEADLARARLSQHGPSASPEIQEQDVMRRIGPERKRDLPSPEYLKEVLNYDPETGLFIWRVSRGRAVKAGSSAGTKRDDGYVFITVNYVRLAAHRVAWAIMTGEWPDEIVDHKDRNPCNNSWKNLRLATPKDSAANRGVYRNNTSGSVGVRYRRGRFHAQIVIKGKAIFLGSFATKEEAANAYSKEARKRDGEFAAK